MIIIMKKIQRISVYILVFLSCRNTPAGALLLQNMIATDHLSSGSGIAVSGDSLYLVGDDAPYIFKMHQRNMEGRSINILQHHGSGKRIPKPVKPDLESCLLTPINGKEHLIAFGSGGLSPYRDSLLVVPTKDEQQLFKVSMQPLYDSIAILSNSERKEINIEGSALVNNQLVLLNRGKNFIITLPWNEMADYIYSKATTPLPGISILKLSMPDVDGYPVGFSGACALNGNQLLFTASVEKTTDYISDGEVLAGYIGILEITGNSTVELIQLEPLKNERGELLPIKIESIDIIGNNNSFPLNAIAVADNDNGETLVMNIRINRKAPGK